MRAPVRRRFGPAGDAGLRAVADVRRRRIGAGDARCSDYNRSGNAGGHCYGGSDSCYGDAGGHWGGGSGGCYRDGAGRNCYDAGAIARGRGAKH